MYADRYAARRGVDAKSLVVAVGLNVAVIAGLALSSPAVRDGTIVKRFIVTQIPLDPPPEPLPPEARTQPHQKARATTPEHVDATTATGAATNDFPLPPLPPMTGAGDPGPVTLPPKVEPSPVPPLFVGAAVDPAYAAGFQPDYPASARRAEQEGRVVIRVLIGVDGRVKAAERIEATNDVFWTATERRALSRWRFRAATKDGIPVEQWKTMTVRFELSQ